MSLTLVSTPNKLVNAVQSNVNAAITQLPYVFKREDNPTGNVDNNGGLVRFLLQGAGGFTAIGETVFWSGVDSVYPPGVYIVTDIDNPVNTLTIQLDYISDQVTTGYANFLTARPDYAVEIKIEEQTPLKTTDTFFFRPSQNGELFIDIGEIVVSLIENNLAALSNYRIQFRENFTGVDFSFTNDVIILAILGERGRGQIGGSNLWNFLLREPLSEAYDFSTEFAGFQMLGLPEAAGDIRSKFYIGMRLRTGPTKNGNTTDVFVDSTVFGDLGDGPNRTGVRIPNGIDGSLLTWIDAGSEYVPSTVNQLSFITDNAAGLLLTHFQNPKKWLGWAQTASVIMDTNFVARTGFGSAQWTEQPRDVNNISNGTTIVTQFGTLSNNIFTVSISDPSAFTGNPNPITQNRIRVREADGGSVFMSSQLEWQYEEECTNPIMVTWINSLGAEEFQLFNIVFDVAYGATEGLIFEAAIDEDMETVTRQKTRLSSDQTLKLLLVAENVPDTDIRALHEIKTSEFINVFLTKDGTKRIGVVATDDFTTGYSVRQSNRNADFNLTIEFPEDYNFFDIIEYNLDGS